jgi:DUF4097 and DUF4098 domain-containing protein YvlB
MAIRVTMPLSCALAAMATAPLAAQSGSPWLEQCQHEGRSERPRVCEVREAGLHPSGTLRVDPGANGGVTVVAWDRDSIAVVAKVQASAQTEEVARRLAAGIRIEAADGAIRATGPSTGRQESWWVGLEVQVPRQTDLDVETINGPLRVEDVKGSLRLRAQNGPVALIGVAGDVNARVQNGPLRVKLAGDQWDGAGLDAEATNGPVDLAIPEHYDAQLETGTVNGPMDLAFPLTVTVQGRLTHRIRATLGRGGAPVRVVTTNGPLTIRRAP